MVEDRRTEQEVEENLKDAQPAKGDPDAGGTRERNLPKFTTRDWLGIAVGIAGTIALFLIAGDCHDASVGHEEQGNQFVQFSGGCAIRYLLAGGFALINLAHVVGIVLFESVGYHGAAEKWFSRLSLYGTPAAIIVSLLIGPA
jgi:hypothetical protein